MTSVEVGIWLEADELEWARRKAEQGGTTISAVLSEAVRQMRQHEAVQVAARVEAMERLLQELGSDDITPEDIARVLAEWRNTP